MGNILSFLFPKPAPAALEAQEELEEIPAAPAKEAVEDQPPTAPARTKKIVEAPITQTVEAEPVIESIGSIEDAAPAEPTPEIIQPEPIKELLPEPLPIIEPIKEPTPELIKELTPELIMEPTPEPGSFCGTVGAEPTQEPIKEPTPEPTKEPTPEPTKEPTPEPIKEPTPEPIMESTTDKIEEPQAGIANIVAEAVDNLVSVSEEVIDDDKPATIEGAAELRDILEKPELIKEKLLLPEPLPIIEPIKEPEPELIMEPTPEPGSFCGTVGAEPTPEPIKEPTPEPTKEPTPEPLKEPTPEPTKEPTPEPLKEPTPEPLKEPTPEPIKESTTDKIEEPQAGIANIVAEAVENLVSVSEEVIDDDKPANVEGAAELRDFLEKPKVAVCEPAEALPLAPPELPNIGELECKLPKEEKEISNLEWTEPLSESLPEPPKDLETPKELLESLEGPQTTSSIASLVADTVGKVSTLTEEVIDDDANEEELIEATSHTSEPVQPIVESVIVPEVPVVTKSDEVVEVIGSIQDDTKEEAEIKPSGGAALLRDILDDK